MFAIKVIATALFSIIVMFLLTRVIGNKQIEQMNLFDYINGITIGNIAGDLAVSRQKDDIYDAVIAMTVYSGVVALIAFLSIKSVWVRRYLTGKSVILIEDGVIYRKNLIKVRLDINDILTVARNQGIFTLSDIKTVIFENNGKLSILKKVKALPPNRYDMNVNIQEPGLEISVILDGIIMNKNLEHAGLSEKWLKKHLREQGYTDYKDIMIATLNEQHELSVYVSNDSKYKKNIFD